jgi:hypothetical protein
VTFNQAPLCACAIDSYLKDRPTSAFGVEKCAQSTVLYLSSVILAYNDPTLKISDTFSRGKIEIRRFLCGLGCCCTTFTSTSPHFYSYFSVFLWNFFFFMHKTKSKADNKETVAQ